MSGDPDAIASLSERVITELEDGETLVVGGRTLEDVLEGLATLDPTSGSS